jgi:general L-amino acid transport system substrate-binding protein
MKKLIASAALAAAALTVATAAGATTLEQIKARGVLNCGSNTGLAGFGQPDAAGNWTGLDVDYCRAIAAAIFDDPTKVKFVPLSAKDRFTALCRRSRSPGPQHHLDAVARHQEWRKLRCHQLL